MRLITPRFTEPLFCPLGRSVRAAAQKSAMKMTEESSPDKHTTMEEVQRLIKKKDEIEEQIKAYYEVLEDVSVSRNSQL